VITPLLSRRIIYQIRTISDHLREDKILWKRLVTSISPKIEFAKFFAIENPVNIVRQEQVVALVINELNSEHARQIFHEGFIEYIKHRLENENANINKEELKESRIGFVKKLIPVWLKNTLLTTFRQPKMDFNKLAFRAYLICKMTRLLKEDADLLNSYN